MEKVIHLHLDPDEPRKLVTRVYNWNLQSASNKEVLLIDHGLVRSDLAALFSTSRWQINPHSYADKWPLDPKLERYFWQWHTQIRADLKRLPIFVTSENLAEDVKQMFGVALSEDELRPFAVERVRRPPAIVRAPAVVIPASTPRPWGHGDRKRF